MKDVVPGTAGLAGGSSSSSDDIPVQAVKVTYDADRISHEVLMRTYWKHAVGPGSGAGRGLCNSLDP